MISKLVYYFLSMMLMAVMLFVSAMALMFAVGKVLNPSYEGVNPLVLVYFLILVVPASALSIWLSYKIMLIYIDRVKGSSLAVKNPKKNFLISMSTLIVILLIWWNS